MLFEYFDLQHDFVLRDGLRHAAQYRSLVAFRVQFHQEIRTDRIDNIIDRHSLDSVTLKVIFPSDDTRAGSIAFRMRGAIPKFENSLPFRNSFVKRTNLSTGFVQKMFD